MEMVFEENKTECGHSYILTALLSIHYR